MTTLAEKIVAIHRALQDADIAHAFGGALALAWCTQSARGTIDIDINVFLTLDEVNTLTVALPPQIPMVPKDREILKQDGQVRLHWDSTPVDIFLSTTAFHHEAQTRIRFETFRGVEIPFLGCTDLAVFKCMFNRSRDWADLEDMLRISSVDIERVIGALTKYLGGSDERVARLVALDASVSPIAE